MTAINDSLNRLKKFRSSVEAKDSLLAEETAAEIGRVVRETSFEPDSDIESRSSESEIQQESIIQRKNRPALRVIEDTAELDFADSVESGVWKQRIQRAKPMLDKAILAVGRIDLLNSPRLSWVGTGWLVSDYIMVTNRHVAKLFVQERAGQFEFMQNGSTLIESEIDFVKEFASERSNTFKLLSCIYMVPEPGPDIALFHVEQSGSNGNLPSAIALSDNPKPTLEAATIGYPAFDSRILDSDLMVRIYGNKFDKKRLAPGAIDHVNSSELIHDCTTLGGNSGSVIIDMNRELQGKPVAVGLHFGGAFLRANYAVPSDLLANVIKQVESGGKPYFKNEVTAVNAKPTSTIQHNQSVNGSGSNNDVSITIPLNISVSLGQPTTSPKITAPATANPSSSIQSSSSIPTGAAAQNDDDEIELASEARPEDYDNRNGFTENFIGNGELNVPLPTVSDDTDVLTFENMGQTMHELRYQNFSVVMKNSRRLLYFSAANLDGTSMQRVSRPRWRLDPRIPKEAQIIKECYGRTPRFSRGHMTRKNDVGWGIHAVRGVTDTMHVTNAAPQMQAFNSPIWLELEDYALDNAVKDGMRISVFTGPYYTDEDPVFHGVQVPVSFWKVIAFKHDDTGELSATGYEMDQNNSLPSEDEFVFGNFTSSYVNAAVQIPISLIEAKSGIDFGSLRDSDPLANVTESIDITTHPLLSRTQIRFI